MADAHHYSEPVQLLAFVLSPQNQWTENLLAPLAETFGTARHTGTFHPFDQTPYYTAEMGETLYRAVISFENLIPPESIGHYKKTANDLEQTLAANGKRIVNIDCGYMDLDKVVLPSYKRGPFKLYAGDGLWLDMLLTYSKGEFRPTPWAFEDFVRNPYRKDLLLIREKYKKALR